MGEGRPVGNRFLGLSNPSIHHLSLNRFVGGGSEACPRGGIEGVGMASSSLDKHKVQFYRAGGDVSNSGTSPKLLQGLTESLFQVREQDQLKNVPSPPFIARNTIHKPTKQKHGNCLSCFVLI